MENNWKEPSNNIVLWAILIVVFLIVAKGLHLAASTSIVPAEPENISAPPVLIESNEEDEAIDEKPSDEILYNDDDSIDTSNWETYTNEEYGFSFRHPIEWIVTNVDYVPDFPEASTVRYTKLENKEDFSLLGAIGVKKYDEDDVSISIFRTGVGDDIVPSDKFVSVSDTELNKIYVQAGEESDALKFEAWYCSKDRLLDTYCDDAPMSESLLMQAEFSMERDLEVPFDKKEHLARWIEYEELFDEVLRSVTFYSPEF